MTNASSALDTVLSYDHVARSFGRKKPVLRDLSVSIARDEVVALLGRNGTGKSTMIALAMGLLRPEAGRVRVFGVDPTARPVEVKRRIGFVGELPHFPPLLSIEQIVALHRHLFPTWDRDLERRLMRRFELDAHRGRLSSLSRGQRQQVSLLCAICHRPELLLLDEPASGLDPAMRREFLETSIRLLNESGATVLLSSHHMGDVERLGGRVLLLESGVIRLDAGLDALREEHSLAVFPRRAVQSLESLQRLPGVLHLRTVGDRVHAVVAEPASSAEPRLRQLLGTDDVHCRALQLEDLFVEMTDDRSAVAA